MQVVAHMNTAHWQVVDSNTVVGILDITKLLFDVISALEKAHRLRLPSHSSRRCAHERMVEALWLVGAQASNSSKSLIDTMDRIESNLVQHTAGTAKQATAPQPPAALPH
jgi:hypothetical protein